MSTGTDTRTDAMIVVRRSDRGRMAGGGTVSYTVEIDGRWVGWVGDERRFTGVRFAGRRWWACHREEGDRAARWNTEGLRTRAAAVDALAERVRRTT